MRTLILFFLFFLGSLPTALATIDITGYMAPSSAGSCDGYIEVTATGTAGPFRIELTSPNHMATADEISGVYRFEGLCSGTYSIVVHNAYGSCAASLQIDLGCTLEVEITTEPACSQSGGSVTVTPVGQGPFTYQWEDGGGYPINGDGELSGLTAGEYYLTVTTADWCSWSGSVSVEEVTDDYP
jgi:hypothetical protein